MFVDPSCCRAKDVYRGFVVLEGRGGGVDLLGICSYDDREGRFTVFDASLGLKPSEMPIASKS